MAAPSSLPFTEYSFFGTLPWALVDIGLFDGVGIISCGISA